MDPPISEELTVGDAGGAGWEKCARQLTLNSVKVLEDFLDIATTVLTNIIEHPDDEKYRMLKLANKAIASRVLPVKGGLNFFFAVGFVRSTKPSGEKIIVLNDPSVDVEIPEDIKWLRSADAFFIYCYILP